MFCVQAPQQKHQDVVFLFHCQFFHVPLAFSPRLSANLTRFVSRSFVFVSLALEPTPGQFLSLMPLELWEPAVQ